MGKYQNVGTPRFYVDYFQYALTTGLIGVGDISNNFEADNNKLKKLFYLNPVNAMPYGVLSNEALVTSVSINTKFNSLDEHNFDYAMVLNHNGWTAQYTFVFTLGIDKQYGTADKVNSFGTPEYNGWSYSDIVAENPELVDEDAGTFSIHHANGLDNIILSNVGAISVGTKYEMPHSPDLDLTMTREFGGAKKQFTKGGALLTNYTYTQPPAWGDGEAWGLYTDPPTNLGARRAGRRTWDLKFSYLSATDVMSDLEMLNIHPIDEGEHDYEPSLTDNNFFSQFMQKTLGGSLRFIFQPDGSDYNPDGFAICVLDQDSISIKQVAHNTYKISLRIMEVW